MRKSAWLLGLLSLSLLAGCGSANGKRGSGISVRIAPTSAFIMVSHSGTFLDQVSGTTNTQVTWSINEGAAGGSITQGGVYTAPAAPGIFHITVTSQADSSKQATSTVTVVTVLLESVTVNAAASAGGTGLIGTATLADVAPAGGIVVTLTSSVPSAASVPATVTIPPGAKAVPFNITTVPVINDTPVLISAATNGITQTANLIVKAPQLLLVSLSASTVKGGTTVTGRVTLGSAAPPAGVVVTLNSSNALQASVPATVTVPGGATTNTFPITTTAVSTSSRLTISGTTGGTAQNASLTLTP